MISWSVHLEVFLTFLNPVKLTIKVNCHEEGGGKGRRKTRVGREPLKLPRHVWTPGLELAGRAAPAPSCAPGCGGEGTRDSGLLLCPSSAG